jgi:lambda family phage portal protein
MPGFLERVATRLGYVSQAAADQQSQQRAQWVARRVLTEQAAQRRSLLAALTTNDTASWGSDFLHINAETATGLTTVRARSRDAAWNNGYAKRFVGMVERNVLGPRGVEYQSRVTQTDGQLKPRVNERLEAGWRTFSKPGALDVTGRYSLRQAERLVLRHTVVDGEVFVRIVPGRGPHGVQIQLLPADAVPVTYSADLGGGRKIRQGIEIDAFGAVLAYHMRRDDTTLDDVGEWAGATMRLLRVPASEVMHIMLPSQIGQLRGVPWMATALKRMYQAADFAASGLNKARESAKRGGWLTQDPDAAPLRPEDLTDGKDGEGQSYASLHDGTWEMLPTGLKAEPFESEYPNIEYGQFIKDCVRDMAGSLDVAYVTLGNDLEAVNYSSGQLGLEDERTFWMGLQEWFIHDAFMAPLHTRWLPYALLVEPELATLQFDRIPQYVAAANWQPHRWRPLDESKTTAAQKEKLAMRLTSPQREMRQAGIDPDEVLAELREWQAKTADLPAAPVPAAAPTPPAPPADPEDDTDDDTADQAARLRVVAGRGG